MVLIGVSAFLGLHAGRLGLWVFFGAVWHWRLGVLGRLHAKRWFGLGLGVRLLFGVPVVGLGLGWWRGCGGLLPGGPAGDGGAPVASVGCWTGLGGRPWGLAGGGPPWPSSAGYTPVQCLLVGADAWPRRPVWGVLGRRMSRNARGHLPVVVPWGVPFSPGLFRFGVVSLPRWSCLGPLGNLGLLFGSLARRRAFWCASHLYLVNSFNGPPQMFYFPLTKF